jgi:entry exclusion lipoprotein TrbK
MKVNNSLALASAALLAALVVGCDNKPEPPKAVDMPQVSEENCKFENVARIDASVRQQFADACFRRGTFKPSPVRTW